MKNPKLIIGIIAIIALLIILWIVYKSSQERVVKPGTTTVQQAGFFDTLLKLFEKKGTATTTGGDPFYCKIFPKLCKQKYCDCSNPGYAVDGVKDSLCNEGSFQFESDCV